VLQAFISGLLAGNVHVYDAGKLEMFIPSFLGVARVEAGKTRSASGLQAFPFLFVINRIYISPLPAFGLLE